MFSFDLVAWLVVVDFAAVVSAAVRPKERKVVRLRREGVRDITPLMRYGSGNLGRRYRQQ